MAATGGKVHLAIVDIDELSELALEGGVQAVPTVIAYKNGKVRDSKFIYLIPFFKTVNNYILICL